MNIAKLLSNNDANALVVVTLADLKEFALSVVQEAKDLILTTTLQPSKAIEINEPEKTNALSGEFMTTDDVMKMAGVDRSTLCRWHNTGYLVHEKIGRRNQYRTALVKQVLHIS